MRWSKRVRGCGCLVVALVVLGPMAIGSSSPAAHADTFYAFPGSLAAPPIVADRSGTACAGTGEDGEHDAAGSGLAFDGRRLLLTCEADHRLVAIDPASGAQLAADDITGFTGAASSISWDPGRAQLWACDDDRDVGLVDLAAKHFEKRFTSTGCAVGLGYDSTDDTLWAVGAGGASVEHYAASGASLASTDIGPQDGCDTTTGLAVEAGRLYLAGGTCRGIIETTKEVVRSGNGVAATSTGGLACDDSTFAGRVYGFGSAALWSSEAHDNTLRAWVLDERDCEPGVHCGTPGTPRVSVGDGSVLEGDSGPARVLRIPVTLSTPSTTEVTVSYVLRAGLFVSQADLVTPLDAPRILHFRPRPSTGLTATTKYIVVRVAPDTGFEDAELGLERVRVELSAPTGGYQVGRRVGLGAIFDDDGAPRTQRIGIASRVAICEGDLPGASSRVPVTISLSEPASQPVTATVAIDDGTAAGGPAAGATADFRKVKATPITLELKPGQVQKQVAITAFGDTSSETDERLTAVIGPASVNLYRFTTRGSVTILNDDPVVATHPDA